MASVAGASSCRDRTPEFRSLIQTLRKIGATRAVDQAELDPSTSKHATTTTSSSSSGSEFNKRASRIGLGIHQTSQKIARLAKLAKKSSMFDDPTVEIQELTSVVKDEITTLNAAVSDLQTLQNMEMAGGIYSEHRVGHYTAVCDDLKSKLMGATKQLQDVLKARTENIKAHENRKQIFSTNTLRDNTFRQPAKPVNEPPPWSSSSNASGSSQPSALPSNGAQAGTQLRRRMAGENTPSQQMEMPMQQQQVVPRQEHYSESRAAALQNVQSTISEISGIFTHLATMVAQQGELAIRSALLLLLLHNMIDDNMDESLTNVEGAHSALLKYLTRISSNRWLMIKIFAILIFFLLVFIFFVV
ncbi:Syntaxin-5, N-terminal, Sly1p-binding domain [Dillenia turbinata]|uniref:Syntaxin-5, N-terminal, Sly1p-binding domain n=1 Tax=Dillenia turbinata TaxID=194707 RepID=A0AAN8VGP5_9MAGN